MNKPAVDICKIQEDVAILDTVLSVPFLYCFYLCWVHADAFGGYNEDKIYGCFSVKFRFFWHQVDPVGSERDEDFGDMCNGFCDGVNVDKDVVEVGGAEHVEIFHEAIIEEVLEAAMRVGETEWHDSIF